MSENASGNAGSGVAALARMSRAMPQFAIRTLGNVVRPTQLMAIVPADSKLEAEAMLPNKDIGFVTPGQSAEIKIDTFNFTKYGLLRGEVINVSQDAITREKPVDRADSGKARAAVADSSEPQGQEPVYVVRVSLHRTQMQVENNIVSLVRGTAVTVEIKTGRRRVIEYLLSPLLRYGHEAARER